MTSQQTRPYDLIVKGGRVFDPGAGLDSIADIGIIGGRIAAIGPSLDPTPPQLEYPPSLGTQVIDATGKYVSPGFIDMHAHVYTGVCPLTVPADPSSSRGGVTTVVSAGDAGAYSISGFRHLIVERSHTRVLAFLHISIVGLITWPYGEVVDIAYADVEKAIDAIERNRDLIVGIKVRETAPDVVGDNGLEPLRRAIQVGEATGLPVMCHIGNTPTVLSELLAMLRPGDILTHCFTGSANNIVVDGALVDGVLEAKERGVVFDIGHGFGSFDFSKADVAFAAGLHPDTISTDLHSLSAAGPAKDLPLTMSKLHAMGMTLSEVIVAVTKRPAEVIRRSEEIGSLDVGREADITIFDISETPMAVEDAYGNQRTLDKHFVVAETIRKGIPWNGPYPHPGPWI